MLTGSIIGGGSGVGSIVGVGVRVIFEMVVGVGTFVGVFVGICGEVVTVGVLESGVGADVGVLVGVFIGICVGEVVCEVLGVNISVGVIPCCFRGKEYAPACSLDVMTGVEDAVMLVSILGGYCCATRSRLMLFINLARIGYEEDVVLSMLNQTAVKEIAVRIPNPLKIANQGVGGLT